MFDDEAVEPIDEHIVQTTFGSTNEYSAHTDHGYILMYQKQRDAENQVDTSAPLNTKSSYTMSEG